MKKFAIIFSVFAMLIASCAYGDEVFSTRRGMHTYYGIKNSSGDIILEPVWRYYS